MKTKITNKALIPLIVGAAVVLGVVLAIVTCARTKGDIVVIHKGNKVLKEIKLSKVEEPYEVDLDTNVLYVEKDGVFMKSAKCPDKICVHTGKISKDGEAIVCAPNKIMVEFKGKNADVDAVAGGR